MKLFLLTAMVSITFVAYGHCGENFLLIANGDCISKQKLEKLAKERTVIALDGGCNQLIETDIEVSAVIGDFDSISGKAKDFFIQSGIKVLPTPDQDYTDLEKGIMYCDELGAASITIASAQGGRTDHSISNLTFLKKYYSPTRRLIMHTENERLEFIRDSETAISGKALDQCAIIGFPECIASSKGLEYDMTEMKLELFSFNSTSNRLKEPVATVAIKGDALVIHPFE